MYEGLDMSTIRLQRKGESLATRLASGLNFFVPLLSSHTTTALSAWCSKSNNNGVVFRVSFVRGHFASACMHSA